MSRRAATQDSPSPGDEHAERAERIRAMLSRWAATDSNDEPAWDIEDISPLELRVPEPGHSETT